MEKDVLSSCQECGTKKKNSKSPWGVNLHTFSFHAPMLNSLPSLLFYNYKHDLIDTTDSSSVKNTCELYDEPLSSLSLSGSEGEHQGMESEGLRFDSSWGLRLFTLSHACDKMKNIFFYHKNCMTDSKENY